MSDVLTNNDLIVAYDILTGLRKQGNISERDKLDILSVQILLEREAADIWNDVDVKKVKRRFMNG